MAWIEFVKLKHNTTLFIKTLGFRLTFYHVITHGFSVTMSLQKINKKINSIKRKLSSLEKRKLELVKIQKQVQEYC